MQLSQCHTVAGRMGMAFAAALHLPLTSPQGELGAGGRLQQTLD